MQNICSNRAAVQPPCIFVLDEVGNKDKLHLWLSCHPERSEGSLFKLPVRFFAQNGLRMTIELGCHPVDRAGIFEMGEFRIVYTNGKDQSP
jgi:hypothetical protein